MLMHGDRWFGCDERHLAKYASVVAGAGVSFLRLYCLFLVLMSCWTSFNLSLLVGRAERLGIPALIPVTALRSVQHVEAVTGGSRCCCF